MNSKTILLAALLLLSIPGLASAGAFIFAGDSNGLDLKTHPIGYTGAGGVLNISVGIDNTTSMPLGASSINDLEIPTQNIISVWNNLNVTTSNVNLFSLPNTSHFDWESVLLHEMGHSLGIAHCNIASESGLTGSDTNYTKSTDGVTTDGNSFNSVFYDLDDGTDNVIGTRDDIRTTTGFGNDVNLHWFKITDNNPFNSLPGTIDSTTYSRDLGDLPVGHNYAENADRTVSGLRGVSNTEAAMQQGSFNGEDQRTLAADDVATLRFAMAGIDETQGTSDDYTINLTYDGIVAPGTSDIMIKFDPTETGFAVSKSGGVFFSPPNNDHAVITTNGIFFHPTVVTWHFNTTLIPVELSEFSIE